MDDIYINLVKHGCVSRSADWPYSNIHRFIAQDAVAEGWGATFEADEGFGER